MNIELIKNYFSKYQRFNRKTVLKFLTEHPEIEKEINVVLNECPEWINAHNIIYGIIHNIHLNYCKICNKRLKFTNKKHTYCSRECI